MNKRVSFALVLLLLIVSFPAFAQGQVLDGGILTNASGGIFAIDQQLWFSLAVPGRLRLLLNGEEVYSGTEPVSGELTALPGEERSYTLSAELFSLPPDNTLLESRSWQVFIDKKAPPHPRLGFKSDANGFSLSQTRGNSIAQGYIDTGSELVYVPDLEIGGAVPASSFPAVVWAVDSAGNYSEPRGEYYEFPGVRIENPVPGSWTNPQMLILSGTGEHETKWTIDGSDPNAANSAAVYSGPVRINRVGRIQLRVGWLDSEGSPQEDTVAFTVTGDGYIPGKSNLFDDFHDLEDEGISASRDIPIPESSLWAMGGKPDHAGGGKVAMQLEPGIRRIAAIHLAAGTNDIESGKAESGIYRFAYLLDGIGAPGGRSWNASEKGEFMLSEQANDDNSPPLKMVYSGRSRVLVSPEDSVRYRWDGDRPWQEGKGVICVPESGGLLYWYVGAQSQEPFRLTVPPLPNPESPALTGFVGFRRLSPADDSSWHIASDNLIYSPQALRNRIFGACDGEDLEWAFLASDGQILDKKRSDRLAPLPPVLVAPIENSWIRGPVTARLEGYEDNVMPVISVSLRYASGREAALKGNNKLDINSPSDELASVTIIAYVEDAAGNHSSSVMRRFTLDPKTIYAAAPEFASGGAGQKGDRDNPFQSLEDALAYAKTNGLATICIGGTLKLENPVVVSKQIRLNGLWDKDPSTLVLGEKAVFSVEGNGELSLSSLKIEKRNWLLPLIKAGKNALVEIANAEITQAGLLLAIDEGGIARVSGSRISLLPGDSQRNSGIVSKSADISISNSSFDMNGLNSLLFDAHGGNIKAEESEFLVSAESTASVFSLVDMVCSLSNNAISARANDYASALEVHNSGILLNSGSIEVSARDCTAILLDRSNAMFLNAAFTVKSSFLSRAMEIRGAFPKVADCAFRYEGSTRRAEVFAGPDAEAPEAETIGGNSFTHFSNIFGNAWPVSRLQGFNHAFAPAGRQNTVLSPSPE
ncbi:chitobiase/beta-hexosaminidase C-terminal domain-containing protein [Leadbettera azotonutricia]|uniref:Uncharacterized protein n=1 Tax=Leadbettera azotonutricia (strain ATCC BAA-888 / DSM 13862 / ZAS-9) TaxID=545695 RepID=F5YE79_LEAAZ|nr:chitobiase/beta-hexosaminidase C-terminal domain-containing protein [Leadbettera azotonutricia]AEF80632.1 hypothetical protein TREAZ_0248 [Leadbettera azotonutricia ZAS-9]